MRPHPLILLSLILASAARRDLPAASAEPDFNRDIRPILSDSCFRCHGPDAEHREADLRLDTFSDATADRGGSPAIKPGDPQASEIIRRMISEDPDLRMPPPDSGRTLTPEQIERIRVWIERGAVYSPHWAFRPIGRPPLPEVKQSAWVRNPVDNFVLARLEAAGLAPSPEADRPTLIRRLYLDLTGLPPDPEQVEAFVQDPAPDAYEQLVERVLADPHYGERWGRHWLDQARYADTHGYTIDSERSIWPYRDWVIQALNRDLPFDQFTIEQLAGDLLPAPPTEQLVATGFHRNTLVNQEGGADAEQFRNEAVVDRVNTTGAVWLGLTVGCAQCHNHKYDPLSQREYYQLFAFFNSTQDVNSVTPTIRVTGTEYETRLAEFDRQLAAAKQKLTVYDGSQKEMRPSPEKEEGQSVNWTMVDPDGFESQAGASWEELEDHSILLSGTSGDSDRYTLTAPAPSGRITAVRLEALTHPSLPQTGPGRAGNGNFVLTEFGLQVVDGPAAVWLQATADHSQLDYDVAGASDGKPETGWAINVASGRLNVNRTAVFVLAEPLAPGEQPRLSFRCDFGPKPPKYNLGRLRLSVTDAPAARLGLPDAERAALAKQLKQAEDERKEFAGAVPTTLVMKELDQPRPSHVLIRGDFLRQGEAVEPDVPDVLPPLPPGEGRRTRLDLARWLVSGENPLPARVLVNRVWMRYFGQGLVETENDFGMQGALPTHPELLDWLARDLLDAGWSLKHLHRRIVTSATYRQSSHARPELVAADPLNKLLARQSRLRVEAEIVRDLALAASGLLDRRLGGPGVYPPQPAGVYAFTQRQAAWPTSQGGDRFRRGLYTFFVRSAPHPLLTTFDTPKFDTTCTRRVRSNTPLQALTLANDAALIEAARALARRLLAESHPGDAQRLHRACLLCLSREPSGAERQRLTEYLEQQRAEFAAAADQARQFCGEPESANGSAAEVAAWTALARVLMNLDEFITRE